MKAAPRKGLHDGLTHPRSQPPTSEPVPANDAAEIPEMDSGEFDARMAAEWARLATAKTVRS